MKNFLGSWEVYDAWRRHCYWGPTGCKNEVPDGNPEWYWSLLEFGVKLRRHAPYFVLTVVLPTFLSCLLTLASFWIDTPSMAVGLNVFNILLQGLFGWDLIRELPPGSGSVPKIVSLYGLNLSLTAIAFTLHVFMQYFEFILPKEFTIPLPKIGESLTKLSQYQLFKSKGLTFDPQTLLQNENFDETMYSYDQSLPKVSSGISLGSGSVLSNENPQMNSLGSADGLVDLGDDGNGGQSVEEREQPNGQVETVMTIVGNESIAVDTSSPLTQQIFLIRRTVFCLMAIIYGIAFPICTINWF
ncbi:unnamed protein product, partial [Mesorhabditis belari]|uniref:Uncharacterized protein n=1 Tax=Mesorhabditis belari TaxID=2138241 RepID=A0AAF3F9T9_9BILA